MSFSKKQIATLSYVVKAAFDIHHGLDLIEFPADLDGASTSDKLTWFRQHETYNACRQPSWKLCNPRQDYLLVLAHFQRLAGQPEAESTRQRNEFGAALNQGSYDSDDCGPGPGSAAWRALQTAAKDADLKPEYIQKIAISKFKESDLRQLTQGQLWHLCYTIRNRAAAKNDRAEFRQKTDPNADRRNKLQTSKNKRKKYHNPLDIPTFGANTTA